MIHRLTTFSGIAFSRDKLIGVGKLRTSIIGGCYFDLLLEGNTVSVPVPRLGEEEGKEEYIKRAEQIRMEFVDWHNLQAD